MNMIGGLDSYLFDFLRYWCHQSLVVIFVMVVMVIYINTVRIQLIPLKFHNPLFI